MNYTPTPQEQEVIRIIKEEKTEFQDGIVWVTDKVNYKMKEIIQKARKNYLGKFDDEKDPITGKKKIFVPLIEDMVETIVKNIDLDTADINIRATNPNGNSAATILRYLVSHFMRKNYFGEVLNEMWRLLCIDGTTVIKVLKNYDKKINRQAIKTKVVDISNIFIDGGEDTIQDAGAVIERHLLKLSETKDYPWDNKHHIQGYTDLTKLSHWDNAIGIGAGNQVPYVEVYERWGELPKFCLTGNEKDRDIWIPCMAIVSNIDRSPVVHKIIENTKGIKPYEECRLRKIFGRWHGRGIGEMLGSLQSYLNETVNLRLNKARISQIGLFKYRKGSGITQQTIHSLISGGAIPVTRMDDIDELRISDVSPSSYQDETNTYLWSQRATGAWDMGRGEALPASMPATTAVLQEKGMRSGMELIQENMGQFLSRLFQRHIIPLLLETIKDEEIVSIVGSPQELKEIDENYIKNVTNKLTLKHLAEKGHFPDPEFIRHTKEIFSGNLDELKRTRYIKVSKKMLEGWEYEVEVFITGESFNKAVLVQQLNEILMGYSQLPGANIDTDAVLKEILDLMGVGGARFMKKPDESPTMPPTQNIPAPQQPMSETEMSGNAMTRERAGAGFTPTL